VNRSAARFGVAGVTGCGIERHHYDEDPTRPGSGSVRGTLAVVRGRVVVLTHYVLSAPCRQEGKGFPLM